MKIIHISAECYPAAKAGGLGDVVGALPKYLGRLGAHTGVIIPKYSVKWINNHSFETVYSGTVRMHQSYIPFSIEKEVHDTLGFPLFVANIPGKFDRPGIYGDPGGGWYGDELERWLCFQQAALQWLAQFWEKPKIIHCHDHHTGLIPFLVKYGLDYQSLRNIPTLFTIHNGAYHGAFSWEKLYLLPYFAAEARVLLDWDNAINPLAAAVKCAWRVTTVSPSYLQELMEYSNGLESLIRSEYRKSYGILNGIDAQVWDPATDSYITHPFKGDIDTFKASNKHILRQRFHLYPHLPMVTFIGRLVREKGADLLPDLYSRILHAGMPVAFVVLGSGEYHIQDAFDRMRYQFPGRFDAAIEYNEALAHQLYAGSDFLIMPSRVEPCGLNQMYSMRYGTVPVVRAVGGLRDTVPDIGEPDASGRGIQFSQFNIDDAQKAIGRAVDLYHRKELLKKVREKIMNIDFSWERSAARYLEIYNQTAL